MTTFKLTLEYDGADFCGWQLQDNAPRTVQGELEKVLSKIFRRKRVVVIGSGRTDRGVHARGQVAHFRASTDMPVDEIQRAMNYHLPGDISILAVEKAGEGFHAQLSARSKLYSYTILNRPYPSSLARRFSYYFPRKLNLSRMRMEARDLLGRHDFSSFANVDASRTCDAVRTIHRLDIRRQGDFVIIHVEGDGFLYKMVRTIVGTLLDAGIGRLPRGGVKAILEHRDRRKAGKAVEPQGLCLEKVGY